MSVEHGLGIVEQDFAVTEQIPYVRHGRTLRQLHLVLNELLQVVTRRRTVRIVDAGKAAHERFDGSIVERIAVAENRLIETGVAVRIRIVRVHSRTVYRLVSVNQILRRAGGITADRSRHVLVGTAFGIIPRFHGIEVTDIGTIVQDILGIAARTVELHIAIRDIRRIKPQIDHIGSCTRSAIAQLGIVLSRRRVQRAGGIQQHAGLESQHGALGYAAVLVVDPLAVRVLRILHGLQLVVHRSQTIQNVNDILDHFLSRSTLQRKSFAFGQQLVGNGDIAIALPEFEMIVSLQKAGIQTICVPVEHFGSILLGLAFLVLMVSILRVVHRVGKTQEVVSRTDRLIELGIKVIRIALRVPATRIELLNAGTLLIVVGLVARTGIAAVADCRETVLHRPVQAGPQPRQVIFVVDYLILVHLLLQVDLEKLVAGIKQSANGEDEQNF